jgi:hypothetical protein
MHNRDKEILYAIAPMLIIGLISLSVILLKLFSEIYWQTINSMV